MKRHVWVLFWIAGFVLLELYANLVPRMLPPGVLPWLGYALGFFVVASLVGRWLLGLRGLPALGMGLHAGWGGNIALGFALGFAVWALKNLVFYGMGKFQVAGWMDASHVASLLGEAMLGMFFSSAINDLMIRGYWFAFCRREGRLGWYLLIATVLYALDDSWNEGIEPMNLVFSAILGLSLAYTVLRTGSIWMSIGIHWGGNVMYRLVSGFDGPGVIRLQDVVEAPRFEYASLLVTALLFPLVYVLLRHRADRSIEAAMTPAPSPTQPS